jgi:hypothetical protein
MQERNETTRELDARINELAAELTCRVFPLLLKHGLKDAWLASQLNLWSLLCGAVKEWSGRWRLASLMGNSNGLCNFVAADLASRTFVIIQTTGVAGPPRQLRVAVVNAVQGVLREAGRANAGAGTCCGRRRLVATSTEKTSNGNESRRWVHVGTLV